MEPTWKEIRELTRLRRRQQRVIRYSANGFVHDWITTYDANPITRFYGFIPNQAETALWHFQCARCYICAEVFSETLLANREHVTPRARGGKHKFNILLSCIECNNIKADRPPDQRATA